MSSSFNKLVYPQLLETMRVRIALLQMERHWLNEEGGLRRRCAGSSFVECLVGC
jgi:hypothetical protein